MRRHSSSGRPGPGDSGPHQTALNGLARRAAVNAPQSPSRWVYFALRQRRPQQGIRNERGTGSPGPDPIAELSARDAPDGAPLEITSPIRVGRKRAPVFRSSLARRNSEKVGGQSRPVGTSTRFWAPLGSNGSCRRSRSRTSRLLSHDAADDNLTQGSANCSSHRNRGESGCLGYGHPTKKKPQIFCYKPTTHLCSILSIPPTHVPTWSTTEDPTTSDHKRLAP